MIAHSTDIYFNGKLIKTISWDHLKLVDFVWMLLNRKHLSGIITEKV